MTYCGAWYICGNTCAALGFWSESPETCMNQTCVPLNRIKYQNTGSTRFWPTVQTQPFESTLQALSNLKTKHRHAQLCLYITNESITKSTSSEYKPKRCPPRFQSYTHIRTRFIHLMRSPQARVGKGENVTADGAFVRRVCQTRAEARAFKYAK